MPIFEYEPSEAFVANDGGRWYVMQNIDHEDEQGFMGCSTQYICDAHGYDTWAQAQEALAKATVQS